MPEIIQQDKWVTQVPRFTLPAEFSNEPKVEKPEVKPAEAVKDAPETPKGEVAEAATPTPEVEKPEVEGTTEKDPEKQTTRRFERRIDRAHRRAAEAQARAELLEKQLLEERAKSAPKPPQDAPKMDQFTDIAEYEKAVRAHEREVATREFRSQQQEAHRRSETEKLGKDWDTQVSKAESKYEDFQEVVGEIKPTSPWAVAIMSSENGADVAYYLGTHEAEVRKISQLSAAQQFLEIGKLSLKLSLPVEKSRTPSKAPQPITPVAPESKPLGDEIRTDQPYEEYRKVGNKLFGRGGR